MGYKIAEEAVKRGHVVTLISGPVKILPPKNIQKLISIETAEDLLAALKKEIKKADCLIMCAAVGDFRVENIAKEKIKRKKRLVLELVPNKDLLKELCSYKKSRLFIGFNLETSNLVRNARLKIKAKNLDIIVANRLSKSHNPFGNNRLDALIIDKSCRKIAINNKSKSYIAQVLLDKIDQLWYLRRKGNL